MMKVRGLVSPRVVSGARMAALAAGDIDELIRINRAEFGGHVMMADADEDDDDDQDDDDDGDSGADGKKSKKGTKAGKSDSDADDADDGDDDSAREAEAYRKRMKAADRRRAEVEAELQALKDKDKSELERAQGENKTLTEQVETLTETVSSLRLQNAFLTANKHTWHDADVALDLARSKKYLDDVVDEDGEVDNKALSKALDRLAKEHGYLVKTADKDDKDDEPDSPSGQPAGGRSDNSKDEQIKRQNLKKRFPVLNR